MYIKGITEIADLPNDVETKEHYKAEQVQRRQEREIRKYKRLRDGAMDPDNKKAYAARVKEWTARHDRFLQDHEYLRKNPKRLAPGYTGNGKPKSSSFNTYSDPIREKLGSAYDSHPKELAELKKLMTDMGVKIREEGTDMKYGPNPSGGGPGVLSIDSSASYSAWLHEFQHVLDDQASGWRGFEILFTEVKTAVEWEDRAYDVEIEFARSQGYNKIVKQLEWLKSERRRELYGKPPRHNG